jgi:FkbM family methyltransferase
MQTPNIHIRSYSTDQYYLDKVFYSNFYRLKKLDVDPQAGSRIVAVDIGAHCGYFVLAALAANYTKCYAFEPFADNYRMLLKNTEVFTDAVSPYQIAAFHRHTTFKLPEPKINSQHVLDYGTIQPSDSGENVLSLSMIEILQGLITEQRINLLKINIGAYLFDFVSLNEQAFGNVENVCFEIPHSPNELKYLKSKLASIGFSDNLVLELKDKGQNFGFLGFFSKNKLTDAFDVEDLKSRNYEPSN